MSEALFKLLVSATRSLVVKLPACETGRCQPPRVATRAGLGGVRWGHGFYCDEHAPERSWDLPYAAHLRGVLVLLDRIEQEDQNAPPGGSR